MGMKQEPSSVTALAQALKDAGMDDTKRGNARMIREVDEKDVVRVFSFKVRPLGADPARQQVKFSQMDVFTLDRNVRSKPLPEIQEAIANRIGVAHWFRKHVAYVVLSPGMSFTVNYG